MPPNGYYSQPSQPDYSFLTEPTPAPGSKLPGSGSMLGRVIVLAVGLILLLIIFNVVKGLLAGPSPMPYYVTTAEDQAELLHLVTGATEQHDISTPNKNFALTTHLTMNTHQANTMQYLSINHRKVDKKTLALKLSASTDAALSEAEASQNFNEAFHDTMKTQLQSYQHDLQIAYSHTTGPKGK